MSNQIEFRHLRYFLAVAQELHYRRAAERLFISQPGLSRQIKQLEEQLGVKLFDRNKKRVALTKSGEYLKQESEYLLSYLEGIVHKLSLIDRGLDGEVRIGFVGSAMQNVIPELILKSNEKYPEIHFALDEMSNQHQIQAIKNSQIDIGFVRLHTVPEGLALKQVFVDHFSLVLPKEHPLQEGSVESITQLKEENFILFSSDYSSTYYEKIMSIFQDAGFRPRISHKSVHANTIFRLIESGLGVAIVPHSLSLGVNLDVKFVELSSIPQRAILSMVWKQDNPNPAVWRILELAT